MSNIFTFQIDDDDELENKQNLQTSDVRLCVQAKDQKKSKSKAVNLEHDDDNECDYNQISDKQNNHIQFRKKQPFNAWVNQQLPNHKTQKSILKKKDEMKQKKPKNNQNNPSKLRGLQVQDLGTTDMEYVSQKKALKVTDIRKFLNTPLGDYKVKAIIKKQGGKLFNFNSVFNVYIQQNNRYLFTVSREGISQYVFSLEKTNISEKKKSYLGKMYANMTGTQFLLFDNGFSPKETRSLECCRKQLASIKYSSSTGPRKFTTIVSTNCQGFYSLEADQNVLQQKWEKKQRDYLSILYSKAPELDPDDGNYKLDFKGIVKKASVKNFILGGVEWQDSLIFGKIDNQTFVMQIKEPLSVFQATAICVSSIHYKLHWK